MTPPSTSTYSAYDDYYNNRRTEFASQFREIADADYDEDDEYIEIDDNCMYLFSLYVSYR